MTKPTQRFVQLLASLFLLLLFAAPVLAEVLQDTTFDPVTISVRTKIKKGGSALIKDPYTIQFGADGSSSLTNKTTGNDLSGAYTEDSLGRVTWDIDDEDLDDYLIAEIERAGTAKGVSLEDLTISVTKSVNKTKAKYVTNKLWLTVNEQIFFDIEGLVDGEALVSTGSVTISGKGLLIKEPPDLLQETAWSFDNATIWAKAKGVSEKETGYFDLYFGPDDDRDLVAGEFLLDDGYETLRGTYERVGYKGGLAFDMDSSDVESIIEEELYDALQDSGYVVDDVNVEITKQTFSGKLSGAVLGINAVFNFTATVELYGQTVVVKGQYGLKGNGAPLDE